MTVKRCYEILDGDYEGTVSRLGSDERISKFLAMFLRDGSFGLLETALGGGDLTAAFRAAHTLKGLGLNLGLTRLTDVSSKITEMLRTGSADAAVPPAFQRLKFVYDETIKVIQTLLAE